MNIIHSIISHFIKPVYAHCDTLDGPVVAAANKAIDERNVNYALIWVQPEGEAVIKQVYEQVMRQLDTANAPEKIGRIKHDFFEKLVKVHREGEGAGFEGLKPAGNTDQALQLADRAVASGDISEVLAHIKSAEHKEHIKHAFDELQQKAQFVVNDLEAGRLYVHTYAHFVHAAEHAINGGKGATGHDH